MATKQLRKFLTCDSCHKAKKDVQTCIDPYSLDVNNEEVETNLCDDCYSESVADI